MSADVSPRDGARDRMVVAAVRLADAWEEFWESVGAYGAQR